MKITATLFFLLNFICLNQVSATTCQDNERLFEHPLLTTEPLCLPKNPQRIVALDMGAAELTLLSGKTLSGAANWLLAEMSVLSPEFASHLPTVTNVGYPASLEKLVNLKPDLILAVGSGEGLAQSIDVKAAQKIAPTVMADPIVYDDWTVSAEFWAAALNETALYKKLIDNYTQRIDAIKKTLGDNAGKTVSIVGTSAYGKSLWLKNTPPAAVISDLGFTRPAAQNYDKDTAKGVYKDVRYPMISEEKIKLADADYLFTFSYPSHDAEGQKQQQKIQDKLKASPLWNSLDAVKNQRVFYVGGHWWRCNSYLLANKVLDDVAQHIAQQPPTVKAFTYPIKP